MKRSKNLGKSETSPKKLYRSKENKVIAGVCGGIGEYFNVDPIWIRLVMVLLALADGVGVVLYILAWILVPENPNQKETKQTKAEEVVANIKAGKADKVVNDVHKKVKKNGNGTVILGIVIVLVGAGLLLKNLFTWFNFNFVWPIVIIAIGLYFMRSKK